MGCLALASFFTMAVTGRLLLNYGGQFVIYLRGFMYIPIMTDNVVSYN